MLARERVERGQVFLRGLEQVADLRRDRREPLEHARDPLLGRRPVLGLEDLAQRGRDQPTLVSAAVHDHIPGEVHRAALPWTTQHPRDRGLEPFVLIGDRQPHAGQPATLQAAEELDPEAARLDLADVEADHLPDAGLVHRVGDHQRLGHDAAPVTNLDVLRVEPEVRVGALQRPLAERGDPLVQTTTDHRDAVLGHPADPELLHQPVDLPGRDTIDVSLHHDRNDRLLRRPTRLQERRKVRRPRPLPRDQQLDLTDPRLPPPLPVPVAMRRAPLGRDLAELSTDLSRDLALHQLARDQHDRLPHEILKPAVAHLRHDISNRRHALTFDHRGVLLLVRLVVEPTSLDATVVGTAHKPGIPATQTLGRQRRSSQNALQSPDLDTKPGDHDHRDRYTTSTGMTPLRSPSRFSAR